MTPTSSSGGLPIGWGFHGTSACGTRLRPCYSGTTKFSVAENVEVRNLFVVLLLGDSPPDLGIWVGLLTSALSFIELIYIFFRYLQGNAVAGWASTLTVISFMFGVLFIIVGMIGSYLGSNIFETLGEEPASLSGENETEGIGLESHARR